MDAFEAAVQASGAPPGAPLSVGGPLAAPETLDEPQGGASVAGSPWETACQMYCPSPHAVCCNNSAVAKFYNKRLGDATADLEGLVHGNPVGEILAFRVYGVR